MATIQIKNVPRTLHEAARLRAKSKGVTLSQYVLGLLKSDLEWPDQIARELHSDTGTWAEDVEVALDSTSLSNGNGCGATTIQVKNVDDSVHERAKRRARLERRTLSNYLLGLLEHDLSYPTLDEWLDMVKQRRPSLDVEIDSAELIRQVREEREAELMQVWDQGRS